MVAGVVTLMLQANPTLTWRWTKFFPIFYRFLIRDHSDVQHILIRSADRHAIGWHDIPEDADDSFSIGDVFQSTVKFNLRNIFSEWREDSLVGDRQIVDRKRDEEEGWVENAAGYFFHRSYGFGLVNADAAGTRC